MPVSTETPLFGQVLRDVSRATALDLEVPAGPRWDGRLLDLDAPYRSVMPLVSAPTAPGDPARGHLRAAAAAGARGRGDQADPRHPARVLPRRPGAAALVADAGRGRRDPGSRASRRDTAPRSIDLVHPADASAAAGRRPGRRAARRRAVPAGAAAGAARPRPAAAASRSTAELAAGLATINAALGPALLPGSVIAVVGHPGDANKVAARVAVAAAADPFSIHIASHDSGALEELRPARRPPGLLARRGDPAQPALAEPPHADGRGGRRSRQPLGPYRPRRHRGDDRARPAVADRTTTTRYAAWVAELGGVQALLVDDTCVATPEALALHGIPALRSPWSLESTRRPGAE